MAEIQDVISALDVFSRASSKQSIEQANTWLLEFQHSVEAWATCNLILQSADAPHAAKLFAAQTFWAKVTYDLHQLSPSQLGPLSQTLISCLQLCASGSRTVITQLCLAISGLALQYPQLENIVPTMVETFGRVPATVPALLEFLNVFPDEVSNNTKIPVSNEEYKERAPKILTAHAKSVLELLTMYIQAHGVTLEIQAQIFQCVKSWVITGEITPEELAGTPLLGFAFEALASNSLFDSAVDLICDIIHETQEVDDCMNVIQILVPKVIALKPRLAEVKEDPEKTRGYCRIFVEAGETYRSLLLHHTENFFPIVEAIVTCSAYPDLDIVPITFYFWFRLAQGIGKRPSVSPLLLDSYQTLLSTIIGHLHFPADSNSMTSQEAEDFRSFRHVMGDTLKDCCYVLGTESCLTVAFNLISEAVARGNIAGGVSWQEIEAPLFSLRSMGAELDPHDDKIIPKIMDLLPLLPEHPRVQYASILVISRYTEWVNEHPTYIPYSLNYVTAGFESSDVEVSAAAGQALKYLCKDCKKHLVAYLPELHTFLSHSGARLAQDDKQQVYEAVAHVISSMPMDEATQTLRMFSLDILYKVRTVANSPTMASKKELEELVEALENLETMLDVIRSFGDDLPSSCYETCVEAWSFFDPLIQKYGADHHITERTTRVLRLGLGLFGNHTLSIVPDVLARTSAAFQATGNPSYLWIIGKIIGRFGNDESPIVRERFREAYETSTAAIAAILRNQSALAVPDVVEDYIQMLLQMVEFIPDILLLSSAFPVAFSVAITGLTLVQADIAFSTLDLLSSILSHDAVTRPPGMTPPPKFALYATAIRQVTASEGFNLVQCLMNGFIGDFPDESISYVVAILRALIVTSPQELVTWLVPVMDGLPVISVPPQAKAQFLLDIRNAVTTRGADGVKNAVIALQRAFRKSRDRRRTGFGDR